MSEPLRLNSPAVEGERGEGVTGPWLEGVGLTCHLIEGSHHQEGHALLP